MFTGVRLSSKQSREHSMVSFHDDSLHRSSIYVIGRVWTWYYTCVLNARIHPTYKYSVNCICIKQQDSGYIWKHIVTQRNKDIHTYQRLIKCSSTNYVIITRSIKCLSYLIFPPVYWVIRTRTHKSNIYFGRPHPNVNSKMTVKVVLVIFPFRLKR